MGGEGAWEQRASGVRRGCIGRSAGISRMESQKVHSRYLILCPPPPTLQHLWGPTSSSP